MNHRLIIILFVFFSIVITEGKALSDQRDMVFVSILPQKSFVQHISGDLVEVKVMVEPGANPVTYEPKPSQMRDLAKSQAYFAVGVPFEDVWLNRIAAVNPSMRLIHTDAGIAKVAMAAHVHGEEEHDGEQSAERRGHDEGGSGLDPHIWLSPTLVKDQAATIYAGLSELYPQHAETFKVNYTAFREEIDRLDERLSAILAPYRGRAFMVFHPSWGYFAAAYGLEQVPIEIEGKQPKPAQVQELVAFAREHAIRVIFAQKQFSRKSAGIIAREIGGEVVTVDPLAEDWFANLEEVGRKFKEAMD